MKKKLLIVDDEAVILETLKIYLEETWEVSTALGGEDALLQMEGANFSAILADVTMPEMNGVEMCQKAMEKWPKIKEKFLFISGHIQDEHLEFFKKHNIRYANKPISVENINYILFEIVK